MAIRDILTYPDPHLHEPADPVTRFDDDLLALVADLRETLMSHGAIGLSATQVGDRRRVLAIRPPGHEGEPDVFVNPVIQSKAMWGFVQESCLSVPGVVGSVIRATRIEAEAQGPDGTSFSGSFDGMAAVCLQHELDHLDGRLFIDRFSFFGRWRARRAAMRYAANA